MAISRSVIAGHVKQAAASRFPSLFVQWRLARRPKSAEGELALLPHLIAPNDITVDVGANLGLYTRVLARLSSKVHAFEPAHATADILRRTSLANVVVHQVALSDWDGQAELNIPRAGAHLSFGLATLETAAIKGQSYLSMKVGRYRLNSVVRENVSFIKIDVEGHELQVLNGAVGLIDRCHPTFLVEAEERHRPNATADLFAFFKARDYNGYFLCDNTLFDADVFDPRFDQDASALLTNGGRRKHRHYVNNFLFFPKENDRSAMLQP